MTAETIGLIYTLGIGFLAILYLFKKARDAKKESDVLQFRTYHRREWLRKRRMARLNQSIKKGKKL
jgi:hypothetical protein